MLRVAFCGSLTTFSTLNVDAMSTFPLTLRVQNARYAILTWLEVLLVTWCASYAAFCYGATMQMKSAPWQQKRYTPLLLLFVLGALAVSIWAIASSASIQYLYLAYGMTLAPFGAYIRASLKKGMKGIASRHLPSGVYGTQAANLIATLIAVTMAVILHQVSLSLHVTAFVQAIAHAFCGTLLLLSLSLEHLLE